ncbi:MAG: hypothetical protein GF317_08305 [Candidatus Lokiarchaeota archaeon]|nr:hypothetical protein [Candidatus Lokiarchaeota archaeon]MBD3199713.1 hypothetical protein [Candidatus Lokiarchaeota archaeon]
METYDLLDKESDGWKKYNSEIYCENYITGEKLQVKTMKGIVMCIYLPMMLLSSMPKLGMWALNSDKFCENSKKVSLI